MTLSLTFALMNRLWPHAAHSLIEGMVESSAAAFEKYDFKTRPEIADLLAHCSVECAAGTAIEENLNYSAERLRQVWPSRFPTLAAAGPFAHNPRALADAVYGGRMGNRPGTDDGWAFRGRGIIDITGRETYDRISVATGFAFVKFPDVVNGPQSFLEVGCAFWRLHGLNALADRNDFRGETLRVNGGLTGYEQRLAWRRLFQEHANLIVEAPAPAKAAA